MANVDVAATTRFAEVEVGGLPREMGRQFGEATRDRFPGLLDHVMMRLNQYRTQPVTLDSALATAGRFFPFVEEYSTDSAEELRGIAEGAGVPPEAVMLINERNEVPTALAP